MKLSGLSCFTFRDGYFLLKSLFWIPVIKWRLKSKGLRGCLRSSLYPERTGSNPVDRKTVERAFRLAKIVNRVSAVYPAGVSCLERSLVLMKFLADLNVAAELRIGTGAAPGESFSAHAWVEINGQVVNDSSRKIEGMRVFPAEQE